MDVGVGHVEEERNDGRAMSRRERGGVGVLADRGEDKKPVLDQQADAGRADPGRGARHDDGLHTRSPNVATR